MNAALDTVRWRLQARRGASIVVLAVAVLTLWWMWPARLGGNTTMVVVEGHSMEPSYRTGDLIVTRRQPHYQRGDIVVFALTPPGSSHRALIVHRLVSIEPDGRIVTQGDNRRQPDGFTLTINDIVGRAELRLPQGGTILYVLSRWWMLALTVGALVTATLWPRSRIGEDANGLQGTRCPVPMPNT